jgi:hypothetical protein
VICLIAASVEVIAILFMLWITMSDDGRKAPPDKAMGEAMGFAAAMIPSMFFGFLSAPFARPRRIRLLLLHALLVFAAFVMLVWTAG